MSERAPAWVDPVMRTGYTARAIVYVVLAGLTFSAAWYGGQTEGTKGAIESLRQSGWIWLLYLVGVGLLAYAAWRLIAAWMDLERHGSGAKGAVARAGLVVTGLIHASLGLYALGAGIGGGGGGGESSTESWTARLMEMPYGRLLVAGVGLIVIGAGIYSARKGLAEKYKDNLRGTRTSERLTPLCKLGLVAHGVVVGIVGCFFVWAAYTADPSDAGGIGQAFETVRSVAFGRILLGVLALGMLGFAAYCMVEAIYRVIPARAGDDVRTLAARAEAKLRTA